MTWTQVECPFEKDKKIQSYLLTAPIYSEEGKGLFLAVCRPRQLGSCPDSPPRPLVLLGLPWEVGIITTQNHTGAAQLAACVCMRGSWSDDR